MCWVQSPLEVFSRLPDTRFWLRRSCIQGLLPKGESEGPSLGEVPCHQKRKT